MARRTGLLSGLVAFVVFVARAEVTPLAAFYAGGADWHKTDTTCGNRFAFQNT